MCNTTGKAYPPTPKPYRYHQCHYDIMLLTSEGNRPLKKDYVMNISSLIHLLLKHDEEVMTWSNMLNGFFRLLL